MHRWTPTSLAARLPAAPDLAEPRSWSAPAAGKAGPPNADGSAPEPLAELVADIVVATDAAGRITAWNPAAERVLGWRAEEVLGRPAAEAIGFSPLAPRTGAKQTPRPRAFAGPVRTRDGRHLLLEGVIGGRAGEAAGSLAVLRQVRTARAAGYLHELELAREAQERSSAERERLLDALTREQRRAEAATRAKSDFLASMSHEIRTPLNGIVGMTALLLDTPLSPEQRSYAETAMRSAEALLSIVNDILDFSKLEAGKLAIEHIPFDLRALLEDLLDLVGVQALDRGLDLVLAYRPGTPVQVIGDPGRVRQVVLNFLSNAIKFTEQGHVLVEARLEDEEGPRARIAIAVEDTGIGISPEQLQHLFTRFNQADSSTTRKYGGTGLGLAISKQLTELMQGRVFAASEPGRGSRFGCVLPFERTPAPRTAGPAFRGRRMLIVDDCAVRRQALAERCAEWGIEVAAVACAAAAPWLLQPGNPPPDVVLEGPAVDPGTLASAWRRLDPAAPPPARILLLDAHGRLSRTSPEDGRVRRLAQPVKGNALRQAIEEALAGPGRPPAKPPEPAPSVAMVCPAPARILLAEDNAVNQKVAACLLDKLGCVVEIAADGRAAIRMATAQRYDLVFMDCHMPEVDGLEATREIRRREEPGRRTPIVAMTALALAEDRAQCLAAGMDDYLSKPVRQEALRELLQRWLPRRPPEGTRG